MGSDRRHETAFQGIRAAGLSLSVLVGVLVVLALPSLAAPPPAEPDTAWAYDVWHDTMSPYCPGRTLAECPSPQADQLRLWILAQAAAGTSREEVQEILFERFGDQILTTPRAEGGWGIAAYALPIAGFLLGGIVVFAVLRKMAAPTQGDGGTVAPPAIDPEVRRQIDEELGA